LRVAITCNGFNKNEFLKLFKGMVKNENN